jgi:hypothetical protein
VAKVCHKSLRLQQILIFVL